MPRLVVEQDCILFHNQESRLLILGPLSDAEQSQTGPEVSVEDGRAAAAFATTQVVSARHNCKSGESARVTRPPGRASSAGLPLRACEVGAARRGAFLLWLLSSWASKKKVTGTGAAPRQSRRSHTNNTSTTPALRAAPPRQGGESTHNPRLIRKLSRQARLRGSGA